MATLNVAWRDPECASIEINRSFSITQLLEVCGESPDRVLIVTDVPQSTKSHIFSVFLKSQGERQACGFEGITQDVRMPSPKRIHHGERFFASSKSLELFRKGRYEDHVSALLLCKLFPDGEREIRSSDPACRERLLP